MDLFGVVYEGGFGGGDRVNCLSVLSLKSDSILWIQKIDANHEMLKVGAFGLGIMKGYHGDFLGGKTPDIYRG